MKKFWGKRSKFGDKLFLRQGKDIIVYNSNPCSRPRLDGMESIFVKSENREDARKKLEKLEKV